MYNREQVVDAWRNSVEMLRVYIYIFFKNLKNAHTRRNRRIKKSRPVKVMV